MRYVMAVLSIWISISLLMTNASAEESASEDSLRSFLGEAKFETTKVFGDERFPNVVVTKSGTVLATWGSSRIRA